MTVLLKNNVSSTLATAISPTDTGIVVASGSRFPTITSGDYFYVTLVSQAGQTEIVKVTARVGNSMTVVRAQDGSLAASFQVGALVDMRVNVASIADLRDEATEITIADAGGYYTSGTVEGALQEAGAVLQDSVSRADVAALLADTVLTYTAGQPSTVATGDIVRTRAEGFAYAVAASGASNHHVATTGGVKLYVQAGDAGYNVKAFGAAGNGVADDTTPIQAAIATYGKVRIPSGTYKCNVTINNKTVIEGDGSLATILKPYNNAIAVMTYTFTAQTQPVYRFWDYHSEVKNVGFMSNVAKTGVGFTFAKTNPADYVTNDEYANNVHFMGCYFEGFDKGLQFPFGNIGTEIYSCGFANNKYGVYTIDCKFPAGAPSNMHAGNKYFYGGELHGNDVGVYINNVVDGFGGINFYSTIFEYNNISVYAYISPRNAPLNFDGIWMEGGGAAAGGTSVIDAWSGATRSDQTVSNKAIILDGPNSPGTRRLTFRAGNVTDIHLKAPNSIVSISDSRVESSPGYAGGPFLVDYPENSVVMLHNPTTDGGWYATGFGLPIVTGIAHQEGVMTDLGIKSTGRIFQTNQRGAKVTGYGPSLAMASALTSAASTGGGSFSLTGTVVSDGRIYSQCNEFTRSAFLSGQFTALTTPASSITTSTGWYVFTLDVKLVSGLLSISVWDRGTAQLAANLIPPSLGKWYTIAAAAYSNGGDTLYLDFVGRNSDATWRVSAYQIHRFGTEQEAWNFVSSNVFVES